MQPIGPLMIEHRLIDKVLAKIKAKLSGQTIPAEFVSGVVDFFRTYADACHHGKEEDILFKALNGRGLKPADRQLMQELLEEHKIGRSTIKQLAENPDKPQAPLAAVLKLYPEHIRKEDKVFFLAAMTYFNESEQQKMLAKMNEFDRRFIHDIYKEKVERM